jgi:hypothetical protein
MNEWQDKECANAAFYGRFWGGSENRIARPTRQKPSLVQAIGELPSDYPGWMMNG